MPEDGYLLDNQQAEAGVRFDALGALFDPTTFRHIEALGIAEGRRCWEVGAGGPSVPSWLAQRVGRTLPRLQREAGLVDVEADAFFPIAGAACAVLERATVLQIRVRLVAAGLATDEEIDQHLDNVDAGILDLATSPLISSWGRKPA